MSILNKLATALDRRDEVPNQELAAQIVAGNDKAAIHELIDNLSNKDKGIQSDCIKVLYEAGAEKPALIAPYTKVFLKLLDSKNNRLQWGAMHALNAIASAKPDDIYEALPQIASGADKGSVIARDHYVAILIKLMAIPKYADDTFQLLNEVLQTSPTNQLPMYAENAMAAIPKQHKATFSQTLQSRLSDFDKESKRKRVEKVLKKIAG
jgi:hypothetical protein